MSGRAGRRGLDERGIVIMMVDEKMEPAVAKNMIKVCFNPPTPPPTSPPLMLCLIGTSRCTQQLVLDRLQHAPQSPTR